MSGLLRRLLGGTEEDRGDGREPRIRLIVGIGNPGSEYANTRRNVGFWVANRLARKHGMEFKTKTGSYHLAEGDIEGHTVAIAKPRTFVNASGGPVVHLIRRLKLDDAQEMLVVSDHIDLPAGKVRLRRKGGGGGQKGITDIINKTKTDEFPRVRIGIGRPAVDGEPTWAPDMVADWVLSDPTPAEREVLDAAVARSIEAIECAIRDGIEAAMNRYNRDDAVSTGDPTE
ncbi:MAG: aminoacyl-tRNA hydrolase [Dehalococcoidia bacterium]